MERKEKVILTNMCMVFDGTKLLVQEKVGKDFKGITCPGGHVDVKKLPNDFKSIFIFSA